MAHSPFLKARTISDAILHFLDSDNKSADIIFRSNVDQEYAYKYTEIIERALSYAYHLKLSGLNRMDRVVIILSTRPEYVYSFFGALLAGGIPVPVSPPSGFRDQTHYIDRISFICSNCQAKFMIFSESDLPFSQRIKLKIDESCKYMEVSACDHVGMSHYDYDAPDPDDVCFIQYTSGSTGIPKGVPLTHKNIVTNIKGIIAGINGGMNEVFVSWLPLYHDMGLVGGILFPMLCNYNLILFPPEAFVFDPIRWFRYITIYKGTLATGNNFAFARCVQKIRDDDLKGIDLSTWRVAWNGSEPISYKTIESFNTRFKKVGFRETTMLPCYGLAEATLAVTFAPVDEKPKYMSFDRNKIYNENRAVPVENGNKDMINPIGYISVGSCIPTISMKIVGSDNNALQEGNIGEICIHGDSVMKNYYGDDETSRDHYHERWFKTGDLGFIYKGELYITGRKKELIIIRGKNFFPVDIETVVKHNNKMCLNAIAFGFIDEHGGDERLAIVYEASEENDEANDRIKKRMQQNLLANLGIRANKIIHTPPKTLPKTANGKIKRLLCKDMFLYSNKNYAL